MDTHDTPPGKRRRMKLKDAAAYLGVSQNKLTLLVEAGRLPYSVDPLDRRLKLVAVDDLDRLKEESLIGEDDSAES